MARTSAKAPGCPILTRTLKLIVVWQVIPLVSPYTINFTDCGAPATVRRFKAATICPEISLDMEIPKQETYTILQKQDVHIVKGYSCEKQRSEFHFKCGAWGHLKLQRVPRIRHNKYVSPTACEGIIRTGTYSNIQGGADTKLELDTWVHLDLNERGSLQEKDDRVSCVGEPLHIDGLLHSNMLVLREYSMLVKEQTFLVYDGHVEVEEDRVSLECLFSHLGCVTGRKTYIWQHGAQLCPLKIVKTISPSVVRDTFFVDHQTQFLTNTTGTFNHPNCPFSVLSTEHPTIFLAPTSTVTDLEVVPVRDIDIVLQTAIHMNYMAYSLQRNFQQQDQEAQRHVCLAHQHQEATQEPHLLPSGNYGYRQGDLYLTFSCTDKIAPLREEQHCFKDIPIAPAGFVNPQSKLFVAHSPKIPCSTSFPLTIQSNEGWLQLNPLPTKCPAPLDMPSPNDPPLVLTDYSHGGLYSAAELAEWQHQMTFPAYHKALLQSITYGACTHEGSCSHTQSDIVPYDLTKLIPAVEKKLNLFSGLNKFLHRYGDLMALICLLVLSFKFLADVVCILLAAARAGPGAAIAMFSQLYLFNRATYLKIMRRHNQSRPSAPANAQIELMPLNPPAIYPQVPSIMAPAPGPRIPLVKFQ